MFHCINDAELPARNEKSDDQLKWFFRGSTHAPMRDEVFSDSLLLSSEGQQKNKINYAPDGGGLQQEKTQEAFFDGKNRVSALLLCLS